MARKIKKTREQHKSILIALEDEKSSRYYIRELLKDKGIIANVIFAKHIGTDPKSVLAAIENFEVNNPKIKYEKAWLVTDRDSFTKENFKCTLETARHRDICVAYSNECYELWLLLHFKDVTGHKDRNLIRRELNHEFESNFGLKYDKAEKYVYSMIIDKQDDAIKRAKRLIKKWKELNPLLDPEKDNPSTKMHILVSCLNDMGGCKKGHYCNYNEE